MVAVDMSVNGDTAVFRVLHNLPNIGAAHVRNADTVSNGIKFVLVGEIKVCSFHFLSLLFPRAKVSRIFGICKKNLNYFLYLIINTTFFKKNLGNACISRFFDLPLQQKTQQQEQKF